MASDKILLVPISACGDSGEHWQPTRPLPLVRGPREAFVIRICPPRFTVKLERISKAEIFSYIQTVKSPNKLGSDYSTIS